MVKIKIPKNIVVALTKVAIKVTGPFGTVIKEKSNNILLHRTTNYIYVLGGQGLELLKKLFRGTSKGYVRKLKIVGVEFKVNVGNSFLNLRLGLSHEINYKIPRNIKIYNPRPRLLVIVGYDERVVSQIAAEIRSLKLPEPYKGKGILYFEEMPLRKEGKKAN